VRFHADRSPLFFAGLNSILPAEPFILGHQ
jgi:hypothetical protein